MPTACLVDDGVGVYCQSNLAYGTCCTLDAQLQSLRRPLFIFSNLVKPFKNGCQWQSQPQNGVSEWNQPQNGKQGSMDLVQFVDHNQVVYYIN